MHSAIEHTFRTVEISIPSDYLSCVKRARPKKPYHVTEIVHADILEEVGDIDVLRILLVQHLLDRVEKGAQVGGRAEPNAKHDPQEPCSRSGGM